MKTLRAAMVLGLLMTAACQPDETLTAYGAADQTWHLVSLDGADFAAPTTILFPAPGQITGQAPCNSYGATQTKPYPWFGAENIATTRMACPDLAAESSFLAALTQAELVEVLGDVLILSAAGGHKMVFQAAAKPKTP